MTTGEPHPDFDKFLSDLNAQQSREFDMDAYYLAEDDAIQHLKSDLELKLMSAGTDMTPYASPEGQGLLDRTLTSLAMHYQSVLERQPNQQSKLEAPPEEPAKTEPTPQLSAEAIARLTALLFGRESDETLDDSSASPTAPSSVEPAHDFDLKRDYAYNLIKKLGVEESLPFRRLLDDIDPGGVCAAELDEVDWELSSSGDAFRKAENDLHVSLVVATRTSQPISQMLIDRLGHRDNIDDVVRAVQRIAVKRVRGIEYMNVDGSLRYDRAAEIDMAYPNSDAILTQIVEETSQLIAEITPDACLAQESWARIVLRPEDSN